MHAQHFTVFEFDLLKGYFKYLGIAPVAGFENTILKRTSMKIEIGEIAVLEAAGIILTNFKLNLGQVNKLLIGKVGHDLYRIKCLPNPILQWCLGSISALCH
jgi:hypothetical protein|tara:strand:- start:18 stop:323 length:306 start_codon:yes stop_codon:yes gene_type:complete